MGLSNDLISQFIKVTNDNTKKKNESTYYGTINDSNGNKYVRLDGSEFLTPISSTVDAKNGERVTVMIKNHTAIVTGNISSPAARTGDVAEIKVSSEEAKTMSNEASIAANNALTKSEEAKKSVTEIQNGIDEIEKDLADTKTLVNSANTNANQAKVDAAAAQIAANKAATSASKAEQSAQEAATKATEAKTASDNAVSASEEASSNANNAISIANTVKEDAAKLSTDLENAVTDLEGQIETVSNTMTANYTTKTEVATVEGSLETKITESASAITTELTNNYSRKSDLTEAEGRLNTKIETQAGQITTIVNDVSRIDTTSQEAVDAANLAKENAEAAVSSANTAITNAQSAKDAADNAKTEAEAANTTATNAAKAIANAQSELNTAKTDLATAQKNLTDLTSRVDATEDEIAAAQKAVEDAQSAVEAAQTKAEEAKTSAVNAQETANIAKANAEKANADLASAKSDLESAKSDLATLQTQADATDEELAAAKERVTAAEAAVEKAQTDATAANTAAANAKTAADNAKEAADIAKTAADQAQADADAANDAVSDLGIRVSTAETKILQNTNSIALCASKDVVDGLGNRISTAESSIETMADEISTKVDSTSDEWKNTTAMIQNATGFNWSIDETAVIATETQYALGDNTTTAPTSGWAATYTWTEGKYVWQKTRYKYANNTYSSWSTAVCISGNTGDKGDKGDPGTSGRGISSTQIRYQAGSSGTTVPTGTWSSTIPATSASAPYLWTRTIISYTDNTTSTFYAVGSTPEGVESIIEEVSNALDVSMDVIVGTQTSATGSWTGVAKFDSLKDGQRIAYWLPYAGSGDATLNLTLSNGTTTGVIACYYGGTTRIKTHYPAGSIIHFTYRKDVSIAGSSTKYTGWWADANYDSGNTYDRTRYAQAIKCSTTAIVADNIIVGTGGLYQHLKLGKAFDVSYPILYASAAIAASSTGTNNYLAIPFTVTTTQSITLTAYKPVYIKGKLSGTTFTPISTSPLTQTIPTTNDGYQYILLGHAYSSTAMYLLPEHPIFQYFNGSFKSVNQIATEAAKTATNFMSYDSTNGLLIGNKTSGSWSGNRAQITGDKFNILNSSGTQLASYGTTTVIGKTSGNNVFIDNDSVEIRTGTTVDASFGSDITLYKSNTEAFSIKDSYISNFIKKHPDYVMYSVGNFSIINGMRYNEIAFDSDKTFNANTPYIWCITNPNNKTEGIAYISFIPSSTFKTSILEYGWDENNRTIYYINNNYEMIRINGNVSMVDNLIELSLIGNVWIKSENDVNGLNSSYAPLAIGVEGGYHLEMDYNEIMAKSDDSTPSHLFLNMEGGNVSINNNCIRAIMVQEGALFAKNKNYNDGNWLGIVDGINESGNTTFGYGGYLNNIGGTNIYGNTVKLFSNDNINSNTSYVIPNGKGFFGTNTSGDIVNNLQPCNANNNCVIGYGSYAKGEGSTNIYGKNVSICSSDVVELSHSTSGVSIGVGVGGGGTNRGIYDYYKSKWMIYGNETDLFLGPPGYNVYRPYYRKGDSSTICWRGAGYVTNSGKDIYFTIPLAYPIIGNPTVTVSSASSGGLVLRENNYYTHGSSSVYVNPSSYTAVKDIDDGAIRVTAKMSNTTNVTNNSPIGIDAYIKITFS